MRMKARSKGALYIYQPTDDPGVEASFRGDDNKLCSVGLAVTICLSPGAGDQPLQQVHTRRRDLSSKGAIHHNRLLSESIDPSARSPRIRNRRAVASQQAYKIHWLIHLFGPCKHREVQSVDGDRIYRAQPTDAELGGDAFDQEPIVPPAQLYRFGSVSAGDALLDS